MCTTTGEQTRSNYKDKGGKGLKTLMFGIARCLIVQLHVIFDCIVNFLFSLLYDSSAKKVPPAKNNLLLESTISIAKKIREKKITAEEVVKTFIERCKEVNGLLNAIVEERYEEAIKEAKEVDRMLKNDSTTAEELEKTKPLLGVPFTTKESNEAKGMLHSMGMLCRKGYRSEEDSTAIANVKNAGGILIAKTNIPEMNLWIESRNLVYGQTNNPYNTTRSVGGSSGGDGAIVAACGVPFAVGSDIGGSTRIPAMLNGVFGHKPSKGMTSLKGIGLRKKVYLDSMAEVGPLCKKAEDLDLLMTVVSGSHLKEPLISTNVDLKKVNVFYQECSGDIRASKVSSDTHSALIKAVDHLEQVSASVTKIKMPGSEYSFRLWRYWMTQEEDYDFKKNITNDKGCASASAELLKLFQGKSEITLAALLKLIDSDFLPQEKEEWAKDVTNKMKAYLLEKLADSGIFIYPAMNPANYHYQSYLSPYSFGCMAIFNVLKFPVCQVPMGLNSQGLPIGIQVVSTPNNDKLCLAVAKELEKTFGGWVPPSVQV